MSVHPGTREDRNQIILSTIQDLSVLDQYDPGYMIRVTRARYNTEELPLTLAEDVIQVYLSRNNRLAFLVEDNDGPVTGFSYDDSGTDFHMYPYLMDGNQVHMHIMSFSGYGLGGSTEQDRADQLALEACEVRKQVVQQMSVILAKSAFGVLNGYDTGKIPVDLLYPLFEEWFEQGVKPLKEASMTDSDLLVCALPGMGRGAG